LRKSSTPFRALTDHPIYTGFFVLHALSGKQWDRRSR
jgi:hypothetical protein